MASFLVGRVRNLRSIFPLKRNILAQIRNISQEKLISRFPVPIMSTLPQDMQARMKDVEEKVASRLLFK